MITAEDYTLLVEVSSTEGIEILPLAQAVRQIVEEWPRNVELLDSVQIRLGGVLIAGSMSTIRALYNRPDFPHRTGGPTKTRHLRRDDGVFGSMER
jgi:hypothetical protein